MYKKKNIAIFAILIFLVIFIFFYFLVIREGKAVFVSCGDDIWYTNKNYTTTEIGGFCFFAENLDTDKYSNGDKIEHLKDNNLWEEAETGACSYYENNKENVAYGKMYNFYAVVDERGLCPEGWRVPTDEDWMNLEIFLGVCKEGSGGCVEDSRNRGSENYAGDKLKGEDYWGKYNKGFINQTGFNATNGGLRNIDGVFMGFDNKSFYWTSTEITGTLVWSRSFMEGQGGIYRYFRSKPMGAYVRCMKEVN